MEKMVPIEIRQSMFEEPSNGSKQTTYLPCNTNKSGLHKTMNNQCHLRYLQFEHFKQCHLWFLFCTWTKDHSVSGRWQRCKCC